MRLSRCINQKVSYNAPILPVSVKRRGFTKLYHISKTFGHSQSTRRFQVSKYLNNRVKFIRIIRIQAQSHNTSGRAFGRTFVK
uniref:Uncharacterized protein n=1 Tax=Pararge aegeria TaxID=116150 RepID=S4P6J2_9NEOP